MPRRDPSQIAFADAMLEKRRQSFTLRKGGLYRLATEILGYDLLREDFHGPICQWIMDHQSDPLNWFSAARGHYKTTLQIADLCRWGLEWPEKTHLVLHAVEEEAQAVVQEVGHHFLRNDLFRALRPEIMPTKTNKRALTASALRLRGIPFSRGAFVRAKGANSEITGKHINGTCRPDDIIGKSTIDDSGLPKVKSWWRNTVTPVMDPGCIVMGSGTRWDPDDIYGEWIEDSDWNTLVHAARETDGVPDYKGKGVLFAERELRRRERQMGPTDWAFQMMNDPSPSGEKPWNPGQCEHFCGFQPTEELPGWTIKGTVFVLSDPAPAKQGSITWDKEKQRGDGSKDDWAIAAVKIGVWRGLQIGIVGEIVTSKDWIPSRGLNEACRLMRKYHTPYFYTEYGVGGNANWSTEMSRAALRNGVSLYRDEKGDLPKYKNTNNLNSKNTRFGALADWAKTMRLFLCRETIAPDELEKFLTQVRGWRPIGKRNTLRFDDSADVVSRITDAALQRYSPQDHSFDDRDPFNPLTREEEFDDDHEVYRSRYCLV